MNEQEIKDCILKNRVLAKQFDLDQSHSIEKDELNYFLSIAKEYLKHTQAQDSKFKVRTTSKPVGLMTFNKVIEISDQIDEEIYLSIEDKKIWLPLKLLLKLSCEEMDSGSEINDSYKENNWFDGPILEIHNSSSQRLYYSGIIREFNKDAVIARVKTDPTYASGLFFLAIVPDFRNSRRDRRKGRTMTTARILIDDKYDKPCFEVVLEPGFFKFGHYNVYDRRNTRLQSVFMGKIQKSCFHSIFKGKIIYDNKKIIYISKQKYILLFHSGNRIIASIKRNRVSMIDTILENKRIYRLEFLQEITAEIKMLIISYLLTIDSKFWLCYRY